MATAFHAPAGATLRARRLLACIVAYRPDADFDTRAADVARQVETLLIVDNAEDASLPPLQTPHVLLHHRNVGGIAGALNAALRYARAEGYTHLALFDHDSTVPAGMLDRLADALDAGQGTLIGPVYVNSATDKPGRFVLDVDGRPASRWIAKGTEVLPAFFLITSGTMIDVERLRGEIDYDELLAVDMVDVQFCLQVRASGGRILLDTSQVMRHGMGNREVGARRFAPPNYSANRYTMIVANRIIIWRRWTRRNPRYIAMDVSVALLDFVRNVLLLRHRLTYLQAVWKGVRRGVGTKLT